MREREHGCQMLACGWRSQLLTHLYFKPNERIIDWKLREGKQNHPKKILPASHTKIPVLCYSYLPFVRKSKALIRLGIAQLQVPSIRFLWKPRCPDQVVIALTVARHFSVF